MKFLPLSAVILFFLVFTTSCAEQKSFTLPDVSDYEYPAIVEIKDIRVGVVTGPYGDMFVEAVLPSLEKMGYSATLVYYSDYTSPNLALAKNEIDLNIFQHYNYLNSFKFENDLALTAIMEIPTVSMGVFSNNIISVNDFEAGMSVSLPDDASNLARALILLESAGIIGLNPMIDKTKATISDIISNPHEIQFVPTKAHELVDSLNNSDVSVINGNYAVSGGLNMLDALFQEVLVDNYYNVIAVRTEDLNKQFVRDIIEVIYSDDFRRVIIDPEGMYAGFQWPRWFHDAE